MKKREPQNLTNLIVFWLKNKVGIKTNIEVDFHWWCDIINIESGTAWRNKSIFVYTSGVAKKGRVKIESIIDVWLDPNDPGFFEKLRGSLPNLPNLKESPRRHQW